jgi:hypothetical protein
MWQGDGEGPPARLAGGGQPTTARSRRLWVVRGMWEQGRKEGLRAWAVVGERGWRPWAGPKE